MRPAHEAVADEADVQGFHARHHLERKRIKAPMTPMAADDQNTNSATPSFFIGGHLRHAVNRSLIVPSQPCASRTAIIEREDVVPGLRLHHDVVGEHAAVPADVLGRLA